MMTITCFTVVFVALTAEPAITEPVMFDTEAADAICGSLQVFPSDNAWNTRVDDWPVHANSEAIVASIGGDKPLRYNTDMAFILVPPDHPKVKLAAIEYADESDHGPFPLPDELPIEGWPALFKRDDDLKKATLDDLQRGVDGFDGDRHAIVVDPASRKLYEFFQMKRTDAGWTAGSAAIFDLSSNKLRPDGWTSADAAGLPIFPAVVRYDELKAGEIKHALRVTVRKSRKAYVAPATHYASDHTDENLPRMGERLRLRRDFDTSKFSPEVRTILVALQQYGMLVADNGIEWAVSCTPDERISVLHEELRRVKGADFEVVEAPQ